MKKILFAIMAAACLIGCDEPDEIPQEVFYVTDSTVCEVRGTFEVVKDLVNNRQEAPNKRYVPPPPKGYAAIATPEVTYLYNWQVYTYYWDVYDWPDYHLEDDIMAQVALGDTVRVHGTVRTLTSNKGRSFQDIIVDSILEITPPVLFRYTDTVENVVIQGKYEPEVSLELSKYALYHYPGISIYLPIPNEEYSYYPADFYYINPDVNFKFASGEDKDEFGYLCGVSVYKDQWVEITGDVLTGVDAYEQPYKLINMKSAKIIPTPEQYKD